MTTDTPRPADLNRMTTRYKLTQVLVESMLDSLTDDLLCERSSAHMAFLGLSDIADEMKAGTWDGGVDMDRARIRGAAAAGDLSRARARGIARLLDRMPIHADDHKATMDALSADRLVRQGVSAADLYLLSGFGGNLLLDQGGRESISGISSIYAGSYSTPDGPVLTVDLRLAPRCWWYNGEIILGDNMHQPDSTMSAAIGRPLREVLSHPWLDDHALTVVEWSQKDTIVTDAARVRIFDQPVSTTSKI